MLLTDDLLLDYKRCQRRAFLNVYGNAQEQDPKRDFLLKLRQESQIHIEKVLQDYYRDYQQPQTLYADWQTKAQATEDLMAQGVPYIYRGVLIRSVPSLSLPQYETRRTSHGAPLAGAPVSFSVPQSVTLLGNPHLLIRQPGHSKFGDWSYYPISIHLGRRPKPEYKLIATFYAYLLANVQGIWPNYAEIILRRQNNYLVELDVWIPRLQEILAQCIESLLNKQEPEVFISRQRCGLCHWYSHCYAIAQSQQHLSLVPGVTPNRYEILQSLGIATIKLLAEVAPNHLGEGIGLEVAVGLKQQAQAIVENRALRKINTKKGFRPTLPTAPIELYFDIEAEPERNLDYLLGILVVDRLHKTEQFHPFLAEKPEDEPLIWQNFLKLVNAYSNAPIFHFSEYEVETIKRLANLYHTPKRDMDRLVARCVDLHHQVTHLATLPVESYSLKSLANWIGFQWRDPGVSGDQCVWWYDQWLKTEDRDLLSAIMRYNEDDCWATFYLKNWLVNFLVES